MKTLNTRNSPVAHVAGLKPPCCILLRRGLQRACRSTDTPGALTPTRGWEVRKRLNQTAAGRLSCYCYCYCWPGGEGMVHSADFSSIFRKRQRRSFLSASRAQFPPRLLSNHVVRIDTVAVRLAISCGLGRRCLRRGPSAELLSPEVPRRKPSLDFLRRLVKVAIRLQHYLALAEHACRQMERRRK